MFDFIPTSTLENFPTFETFQILLFHSLLLATTVGRLKWIIEIVWIGKIPYIPVLVRLNLSGMWYFSRIRVACDHKRSL